jgi:polysaccharide export outer membrane protein
MKLTHSLASPVVIALGFIAALGVASPARAGAGPETFGSVVKGDTYRLGQGDKLRIEVYKDAQLSQSVQVRPDGKITLPLLGDIQADGQTPIQLHDVITEQLKTYMTNPVVTVIVVETKPAVAYVMGEVNHPGAFALQDDQLTVLQALALAGGLKDFANSKNIKILRKSNSKNGQVTDFNYKDAIRGSAPVYLHAGDTVVVPD